MKAAVEADQPVEVEPADQARQRRPVLRDLPVRAGRKAADVAVVVVAAGDVDVVRLCLDPVSAAGPGASDRRGFRW